MYVYEKKEGDTYVMKIAKCNWCGAEIIAVDDKYICPNCRKDWMEDERN